MMSGKEAGSGAVRAAPVPCTRREGPDMDETRLTAEELREKLRTQEEQANRKLLSLEWVIGIGSSLTFLMGLYSGVYAVTNLPWRVLLIGGSSAIFLTGGYCALKLEQSAGYYECPECGHRYVPTLGAVFLAPHFGRTRRMKCPKCGRRAFQKKVLTKD